MMRHIGFTLLELMIAIMLFGMISLAAYKLFNSVSQAQQASESVLDRLDVMLRAEVVIEKDFFQVVSRPVRNSSGEKLPALKSSANSSTLIEFTRTGWRNPLWQIRSDLQRVAYALEGGELIRYYWPMLDRSPETPKVRQVVLTDIKSAKFRFLDDKKKWLSTWPPPKQEQQNSNKIKNKKSGENMPTALELTIQHEKFGPIVTVVPLITFQVSNQKRQFRGFEGSEDEIESETNNSPLFRGWR